MTAVTAPFAAVEASLAADTMRLLSNAQAFVAGGDFPVIFDAAFVPMLQGIDAARPQFEALDGDLVTHGVVEGTAVTIRGKHYVARNQHADGAGMTLVLLEAAL